MRIYRLGWYGGAGAVVVYDSVTNLAARNESTRCGAQSTIPSIAAGERDYGLVECAWTQPVRPAIANLSSGLYIVTIGATINGNVTNNAAMFFVRDDASTSRLVIVNPTDAQAYASWSDTPDAAHDSGFKPLNLYGQGTGGTWPRATKVSFNRPMGVSGVVEFLKTDYPLIRFLEREGISYSIATDIDLHFNGRLLANRSSVVISGHGEYWSHATRERLDAFVRLGHNVVAMAANTGYWQIRYEPSPSGQPGPVVVGYKETATKLAPPAACGETIIPRSAAHCADPYYTDSDPANDYLVTTQFRMPPVSLPEQLLLGVQYQLGILDPQTGDTLIPPSNTFELPITLMTNEISSMQSLGSGFTPMGAQVVGVPLGEYQLGNIGWEADVIHPQWLLQLAPTACLRVIGQTQWTTASTPNGPAEVWHADVTADKQAHAVLYRRNAQSGYVIAGLSMLWSWGLDDWASSHGFGGAYVARVDARIQSLTRNMLQAADGGSFGGDCATPVRYTYSFANIIPGAVGTSLVLKESDAPGRWATVPVKQGAGGVSLDVDPLDPRGSARLAGWAQASDAYDLFVADANGDGKADLIAKERHSPGYWYVALGDGQTFHPEPAPWAGGWAVESAAYDLFVADVDGDGKADLVAKEKHSPGIWYVALSSGSSFVGQPLPWAGGWAVESAAYDLFVADVNGDGKADLVAKEKHSPGYWYVALSSGSSFVGQLLPWAGGWAVESAAYDLFVADVNGDARADLIAKERNPPGNWYAALSSGTAFAPQASPWLGGWATSSGAYELTVVDLNADGRADLVAREKSGRGDWSVATSNGSAFVPQAMPLLRHIEGPRCTNELDLDSDDDGIPDAVEDAHNNGVVDAGETDPCKADSDGDGIQDGTESGVTTPIADPDGNGPMLGTDLIVFVRDADAATTTNPLDPDTDHDGYADGVEDANHNGAWDAAESNPSDANSPPPTAKVPAARLWQLGMLGSALLLIGSGALRRRKGFPRRCRSMRS